MIMKRSIYMVGMLVVGLLICGSITPDIAVAQDENPVRSIFLDTFYGLAAGALVGVAISAPQDNPDWRENVGSGAAIGAVAGLVFGVIYEGKPLVTESKAMLDMEDAQVKLQMPTLQTKVEQDEEQKPQTEYSVDLLCYRF